MFSYQKFLPAVLASRALHEDVIHRREDRRRRATIRASKSVFSERGNLFGRGLTGLLHHPIKRIKSAKANGLEQFRAAVDVGRPTISSDPRLRNIILRVRQAPIR